MTAKEHRASAKAAMPDLNPAQFAEMGKKQVEAMSDMQQELMSSIEQMNREWAARIKAETDLASEFVGKLSAARSVPDTTSIYQEWLSRRMEMFAEDSRRFVADSQKFMAATSRMLSGGFKGGGT